MSDYTPTTEALVFAYTENKYAALGISYGHAEETVAREEFDRWFASEIEKAEYRGAVKAGREIVEANLAKSDHEFGEFM